MSLTANPDVRAGTRARNFKIATVVCTCLTALCFWKQVLVVPVFAIATVVLSRYAIKHGADKLQMNVMAVVCIVFAIPVLIVLPFVLINMPHLSVGGISLSR